MGGDRRGARFGNGNLLSDHQALQWGSSISRFNAYGYEHPRPTVAQRKKDRELDSLDRGRYCLYPLVHLSKSVFYGSSLSALAVPSNWGTFWLAEILTGATNCDRPSEKLPAMIGVVIGKFFPPHRGHKFLIDSTLAQVDELTVIVCDRRNQSISAETRARWLREIHPSAKVIITPDDLPDEPEPWAQRTIKILRRKPDVVFTSEEYGEGYAKAMDCRHVLVDLNRSSVPISATLIRSNPLSFLDFLEPCVRAYFVKRVVLIGVESTGKTTLAEALAQELNTNWIEEYGREYSAVKVDYWTTQDFVNIATEQQRRENFAARTSDQVLICDTNAFATSVWHLRYMGQYSPEVNEIADKDHVDLYLLAMPDFPFVQDGTRDGEHIRHEMHNWFVERLGQQKAPVVELTGPPEKRLRAALVAIDVYFGLTSTVIT